MKAWRGRVGSAPPDRGVSAFRTAEAADAAALADLHATAFHRGWGTDEIESLLLDDTVVAHVVAPAGTPAGFVLSRRATDEAEILSIVVERRSRRRGLGRALLRGHIAALGARGVCQLFLEVDEDNAAARALYLDEDFVEVGRRANYYENAAGTRSSALVLCRELRPRLTDDACRGF